jgi:hypothetical protein
LANTHIKLWAGRNTHERFWIRLPKSVASTIQRLWGVASLSTRLNKSFEANDEAKDAKQQEKLAASVLKPILSWKHVLFLLD